MTTIKKAEFERIINQARSMADNGDVEGAAIFTKSKVLEAELGLLSGKYLEKLNMISNRYSRTHQHLVDRENGCSVELPYAG